MKPVFAQDETGLRWLICEGDPAWPAVHELHLRGVREFVFMRARILGKGSVECPTINPSWDVDNPAVAALVRRYARLRDSEGVLRGSDRSSGDVAPAVGADPPHPPG